MWLGRCAYNVGGEGLSMWWFCCLFVYGYRVCLGIGLGYLRVRGIFCFGVGVVIVYYLVC